LDSLRTAGCDPSLASTAIFAASAADVDMVVVGGRPVVEGGAHLAVPDVAGELAAAIATLYP
jgi:cytosine/adenosine deaminase-related metal-dependent hydrolase